MRIELRVRVSRVLIAGWRLRAWAGAIALLILPVAGWTAQPAAVVVRVIEAESGRPLPNAEVLDLDAGRPRFTDARGEARVPWPGDGRLRLRVRQIGFQFVEQSIQRGTQIARDTTTVTLRRVAFALPTVFTSATTSCEVDADTLSRVLSASVLAQLRAGAERYASFVRAYPFRVSVDRRTATVRPDGKGTHIRTQIDDDPGDRWSLPYRPGDVMDRSEPGFSVPIHFVATLADPRFWEHHCFAVRSIETRDDRRLLRLEFIPAPTVRGVDWAGEAYIDSATSFLHRVAFRLVGLGAHDVPRRFEGYTAFRSPTPYIYVPDSTVTWWWLRAPQDTAGWGVPHVVQLTRVRELRYRKAAPPAADTGRLDRPSATGQQAAGADRRSTAP